MVKEDFSPKKGEDTSGSSPETTEMGFLHGRATDTNYVLSEAEQVTINTVNKALYDADVIIVRLGGKAGRLGECIIATALLESLFLALCSIGKAGTPLNIMIDGAARELFAEKNYQEKYWDDITVSCLPFDQDGMEITDLPMAANNILILDFHGKNDGMPYLQVEVKQSVQPKTVATLKHLFRVGVRSYAHRGPERRYADFIEELFGLPEKSLDGFQAQPCILFSREDDERYRLLAEEFKLNLDAIQVICFFQSAVIAKCYELWDEVMTILCDYFAQNFPQKKLDFFIACGPDAEQPEGLRRQDLAEEFHDFTGVSHNARVLVHETPSLRDLAILTKHATLVLSNDTGPGHIAGALQVPTIVPYLPGNVYSKKVWSSSLWHHGVTLDPNPFTFRQIEAAILWRGTDIINSIPSEALGAEVVKSLPPEFQVPHS